MRQLEKKILIKANMKLITGLRIGDSKENIEIGGVDSPVVRRKDTYEPYIPGSSLKGKMRCLLELMAGENFESNCQNMGSLICQLFGASENKRQGKKIKEQEEELNKAKKAYDDGHFTEEEYKQKSKTITQQLSKYTSTQSRIIVRDAYLTEEWEKKLRESEYTDMPYTEIKWENVIDRVRGTAEHPRQLERIPAGAEFDLNFVINIYSGDDENKLYKLFESGVRALNDDYLGGSGTRGYGQVEIKVTNTDPKTVKEHYLKDLEELLKS